MDIGAVRNMDAEQQEIGRGEAQPEAAPSAGLARSARTVDVGGPALRCDGCSLPYSGQGRAPLTGQCGHTSCEACWAGGSMVCGRCSTPSTPNSHSQLQHSFPEVPRDLLAPLNVDPLSAVTGRTAGSTDNADHQAVTSVMTGTQQQQLERQQTAARTATWAAAAARQASASATAAAVSARRGPGGISWQ